MTQALKDIVINALEEIKATNITTIDVRELTGLMDTMVVATGNSNRQVKSLANSVVVDAKKAGHILIGVEGDDTSEWILRPGDHPDDRFGDRDAILGAPESDQ